MRIVRFTNVLVAGMALWVIPAAAFCQDEAVRGWVGALASEDFKERVQAQDKIEEWANSNPAKSKGFLLREYEVAKEPEVRLRLRESLKTVVIDDYQAQHAPGYLGITMEDVNGGLPGPKPGILVKMVQPGSPADQGGLKNNDVILAIDDKPINVAADVSATLQGTTPGQTRKIRVLRDKKEQVIAVTF